MKLTGFARVNQTARYYEVAGTGYPLVLVHGFSLDNRMGCGTTSLKGLPGTTG